MKERISILAPRVKPSYSPEQIVGRGIILLFAVIGLIDVLTAGALRK